MLGGLHGHHCRQGDKAMKKHLKRCRVCGQEYRQFSSTQRACSFDCAVALTNTDRKKKERKELTAARRETKEKLKALMTRTKWYAKLQVVVNQWVLYRDRNDPCCTCGTTNDVKFDAGHFHTRKARPDIRFELTNIAKQCSVRCNVHGSGMRNEMEKFIAGKYGADHIDFLNRIQPSLKDQFPNWQDVEAEIKRYREMLRDVGVRPNI